MRLLFYWAFSMVIAKGYIDMEMTVWIELILDKLKALNVFHATST